MAQVLFDSANKSMRKRFKRATLQVVLGWVVLLALAFYSGLIEDRSHIAAKTDFFFFHQILRN